jgi:hypothetical protein
MPQPSEEEKTQETQPEQKTENEKKSTKGLYDQCRSDFFR